MKFSRPIVIAIAISLLLVIGVFIFFSALRPLVTEGRVSHVGLSISLVEEGLLTATEDREFELVSIRDYCALVRVLPVSISLGGGQVTEAHYKVDQFIANGKAVEPEIIVEKERVIVRAPPQLAPCQEGKNVLHLVLSVRFSAGQDGNLKIMRWPIYDVGQEVELMSLDAEVYFLLANPDGIPPEASLVRGGGRKRFGSVGNLFKLQDTRPFGIGELGMLELSWYSLEA